MAGLGIGGMSHATFSSPIPLHQQQQRSDIKIAADNIRFTNITLAMNRAGNSNGAPPGSYRKKNQRQIRLARRRKHAAGHKKAFC